MYTKLMSLSVIRFKTNNNNNHYNNKQHCHHHHISPQAYVHDGVLRPSRRSSIAHVTAQPETYQVLI